GESGLRPRKERPVCAPPFSHRRARHRRSPATSRRALPARAAPASAQAAAPRPPPAATRGSAASRSGRRAIPPLAAARPRAPRSAPRTRSLPGKRDRRAACGPDGETAAPPSGSRAPPRATTDQEPARASASPPPRPPYADDGGRLRRREAGPFIPLAAPVPLNGCWDTPLRGQSLVRRPGYVWAGMETGGSATRRAAATAGAAV